MEINKERLRVKMLWAKIVPWMEFDSQFEKHLLWENISTILPKPKPAQPSKKAFAGKSIQQICLFISQDFRFLHPHDDSKTC